MVRAAERRRRAPVLTTRPSCPRGVASVGDGLEDETLQELAVMDADGARRLGHRDDDELLLGIDPEGGAVRTAPVVVAGGAGQIRQAGFAADGEAEAEAV